MNKDASILVVDDTPANLKILDEMLSAAGYEPRLVPSGQLALASIQNEKPDIILLDIRMPEMNGYEVCCEIKENPELQDIPIIFISALDDVQDKVEAFRSGGVDYVTKPFQEEEVLARVETHLTNFHLQEMLKVKNRELEEALAHVKTLHGLLPICSGCKKIRDDSGYWNQIERYIAEHSDAEFSHGLCPDCARSLYPDLNLTEIEEEDMVK